MGHILRNPAEIPSKVEVIFGNHHICCQIQEVDFTHSGLELIRIITNSKKQLSLLAREVQMVVTTIVDKEEQRFLDTISLITELPELFDQSIDGIDWAKANTLIDELGVLKLGYKLEIFCDVTINTSDGQHKLWSEDQYIDEVYWSLIADYTERKDIQLKGIFKYQGFNLVLVKLNPFVEVIKKNAHVSPIH